VDAAERFWVRRNDFATFVSVDLSVFYREPEMRIEGNVELSRGYFEVFGKRFEIDDGSIHFDGHQEIDPTIDIVATHQLQSQPGNTVTVKVSGRLSRLQVDFSSTVPVSSQGEIVALLLTGSSQASQGLGLDGSGSTQAAGEQAGDFVKGLALGILTLSLREEFGEFIPVLAVETASGSQGTRVRAGFNADQAIPDWLRPIVRGIYVEGFFTAQNNDRNAPNTTTTTYSNATQGQQVGFLMELQFPRNIVGAGTYAPQNNWGLDVTWQP
jgi:translocation and assembly module TamB